MCDEAAMRGHSGQSISTAKIALVILKDNPFKPEILRLVARLGMGTANPAD
jgi:hypothetical protein